MRRRPIAAVLAAAAVAGTIAAARPAEAPTVRAVVVAADLPAGHVLRAQDVSALDVSPDLLPSGAVATGAVPLGRVVAGPLRAGQVLTDTAVLAPSLLAGHPPETVLATIRVIDPAATAAARPGDEVSVVAADLMGAGEASVVASRVHVVALPDGETGTVAPGTGQPVLLAVDESTALRLAEASVTSQLTLLLEQQTS
ncbi:MAG: flagellar biosynthesis protein FlgA [Nocardioidaceae bacterium]|jgi:Flp pilus assembly protein CpaB|nr:flagellar biosynthesis protein FlgA [Nocardioidaceae bacterium]